MFLWERAVMIPACREYQLLPGCLQSLSQLPQKIIAIVVLNEREDAPKDLREDNQQTRRWLLSHPHRKNSTKEYQIQFPNLDILLLDHSSLGRPLGPKQGVGKARDLGMRRCIDLIKSDQVQCPWIWSTDADARFSTDYLQQPMDGTGVAMLPYHHYPASPALEIYDIGLRYYALGLDWAQSPYAFPTLGSTITIHYKLYEMVNGFPDRLAAEDFYLLNKAAKFAPLRYLNRQPIQLIGRPSDRVPFGTGRGMMEIEAKGLQHNFYHPQCFQIIKEWLTILNTADDTELLTNLDSLVPNFPGLRKLARITKQRVSKKQQIRRRHEFFDAFWHMKLIHHLRDHHFPSLFWKEALQKATFLPELPEERVLIKKRLEEEEFQKFHNREFGLLRLSENQS